MDNMNNVNNTNNANDMTDMTDMNNVNYNVVNSAFLGNVEVDSNDEKAGKSKSGKKKFIIIGAISILVAIIAVVAIFIVRMFIGTVPVDDLEHISDACEEVFGEALEAEEIDELLISANKEYEVKRKGFITGGVENVAYVVTWLEFIDESEAEKYVNDYENSYDEDFEDKDDELYDFDKTSSRNKIEWSYVYENAKIKAGRALIIWTDNYVLHVVLYGNGEQVDGLYEEFKSNIK